MFAFVKAFVAHKRKLTNSSSLCSPAHLIKIGVIVWDFISKMSAMATNTPPAPPVMALKPHIRPSQNVLWWETSACVHKHTHRLQVRLTHFILCWYYMVYYDLKMVPSTVLSRRAEAERWYWFVKSEMRGFR